MPKKPTEPYGHIAFGKDGSVRKVIKKLPDIKLEQEIEVGDLFAGRLATIRGRQYEVEPCDENDHDFRLHAKNEKILIQATEIVSRDYLRLLSIDDYRNGNHKFTEFVHMQVDEIYGVDLEAKEIVILDRLKAKIQKHYSKPQEPFWLLIWTVCSDFYPFWVEGGVSRVSQGVIRVREYVAQNGADPFDEIWFVHLDHVAKLIWPE